MRAAGNSGGKPKKTVYVKTRAGRVVNTSASGVKPNKPRVVKARKPLTAAAGKTYSGSAKTHKGPPLKKKGPGPLDEVKGAIKTADRVMKTIAPPGVQSADRTKIAVKKGALKPHPVPKGAKQSAAGFSPDVTSAAKAAKNLAVVVPASTAVTAYHQPLKTVGDTAKSVVSIPAGLIRAGLNPGESAKGIAADYVRRYDAAAKGDYNAFHKRQMKEGAAPEVFDIAGVATVGGATTGRVLQSAAKGGKLGARAERVATQATKTRLSGSDHVVTRAPSKNFYKNAANAARHNLRVRRQVRRAAKPEAPAIVREAMGAAGDPAVAKSIARHNRKTAKRGTKPVGAKAARKAIRRQVPEATPIRLRKADRAQVRAVAHEGGVTLQRMKAEQHREVLGKTGVQGTLKNLSKDEQAAYKYQAQYAPKTPADARRILIRHRDRIRRERAKNPDLKPVVDELPVLDRLIKNPEAAFTPRLRAAVRFEGNRSRRLAANDPGVSVDQAVRRAHMPQGELLGVKPIEGETAVQYARRVRQAGREHGLAAPSYFKSEELPSGLHHMFAKGGASAVREPGAYTGALTRTGRESGDVQIAVRSAAENIKRKFNWNHVADTVDQHVLPWSKEKNYTAYELRKELARRGIDPNSVRLWNPRLMREQRASVGEHAADALDPSFSSGHVHSALQHATASLEDLALNKEQFQKTGWQVAPKSVIDEVTNTATARGGEGWLGRGYDITKGQISRVLLANPAWLGFQVGSNALMAGLAGVTPADAARSVAFFRRLKSDPAFKADVEAVFGAHGWYKEQRRMGAAGGSMTRAWGAVKDTPFYRRGLEGKSPLDALFFRPDNAQNNFFRRAVMYNRLKREAYRRMGQDATAMVKAQQRITGMLKGPPEEQMRVLAANKKLVEQYAQHVDDFLGNWTRYTARERHYFSRFVMFYGFLRFSTRLAFYTMPVKHPIMSSILLQLGRLEKDEITRIFGTNPPPWEIGNLYAPFTGFGQTPSKADANRRVPTVRLVPFFNAMQLDSPGAAVGMANPLVGTALNQMAGKNVALDQPYTVRGSTNYVQHSGDLSLADRLHLAVADLAHLSPWERAVEAAKLRGKQTSDSSIFFPRPIKYKNPAKKAQQNARIKQENQQGAARRALEVLAPQIGTDGSRRIKSAQEWAARKDGKPAKKKRVKRNTGSPWDTTSRGGGSPWDASTSGGKSPWDR